MGLLDWFGGGKAAAVSMPEVDEPANLAQIFDDARKSAAGGEGRHVVIVTPGRMLMFHPVPPAGSMPEAQVKQMEGMIPPAKPRQIAVIAHTELGALQQNIAKAIPFLGIMMGFAYIGHTVWIFEGHPSALAHGCRDADVLFVDGAMVPFLQPDWKTVAAAAMRNRAAEIYVHDRATYSLRKA